MQGWQRFCVEVTRFFWYPVQIISGSRDDKCIIHFLELATARKYLVFSKEALRQKYPS